MRKLLRATRISASPVLGQRERRVYTRAVIIHRQRPIGGLAFLVIALVTVPFALGGSPAAFAVAVIVWAGIVVLLVRRVRDRGKSKNPPPWVV